MNDDNGSDAGVKLCLVRRQESYEASERRRLPTANYLLESEVGQLAYLCMCYMRMEMLAKRQRDRASNAGQK